MPEKPQELGKLLADLESRRKQSLETIYKELGVIVEKSDPGSLRRLEQTLAKCVEFYQNGKIGDEHFDRAAARKWLKDVERAATRLADLLESAPPGPPEGADCEPKDFVVWRMLGGRDLTAHTTLKTNIRKIAIAAADPATIPGAHWKGRAPSSALNVLIHGLVRSYQLFTGKTLQDVGISRHPVDSRPDGPFWRVVRAMLDWAGEDGVTDEALAQAIKRKLARMKSRKSS